VRDYKIFIELDSCFTVIFLKTIHNVFADVRVLAYGPVSLALKGNQYIQQPLEATYHQRHMSMLAARYSNW
jgi:hypothetical protein